MVQNPASYKVSLFLGRHATLHSGLWSFSETFSEALREEILFRSEFDPELVCIYGGVNWQNQAKIVTKKLPLPSYPGCRYLGVIMDLFYHEKSANIIHGTANFLPLRSTKAKRVLSLHDFFQAFPVNSQKSIYVYLRSRFYLHIYTKLLRQVDLVLCSSLATVKILKTRFKGNYIVKLLTLPLKEIYLTSSTSSKLNKNNYLVSFVSSDFRKNPELTIKAFSLAIKTHSDLQLFLVVNNRAILNKISRLVKNLELEDKVKFFYQISDQELKKLYQASKGLVFLSSAEGFAYPVFEALSQGCPVLCANNLEYKDHLSSANEAVISCDINDINAVVVGINKVLNCSPNWDKIKLEIQDKFSMRTFAKQVLDYYLEVI